MKDLSGTIIDKIKQENIRPYPKWRFTVSRGCIVVLFLTSILLGFLGTAIALFQIRNSEWELYHHAGHSFAEFILLSLPWFWLLVLCGLTTVSFYYFRKMGRGYKYNTLLVVGVSLVISLSVGACLNLTRIPGILETVFETNSGWYRAANSHRYRVWMAPGNGFLAGSIEVLHSEGIIDIEDLDGRIWRVDVSAADWRGRLTPATGLQIKLIGEKTGERNFTANEIRPWKGRRYLESRNCGGTCTAPGTWKKGRGKNGSCGSGSDQNRKK